MNSIINLISTKLIKCAVSFSSLFFFVNLKIFNCFFFLFLVESDEAPMNYISIDLLESGTRVKEFEYPKNARISCFICGEGLSAQNNLTIHLARAHKTNLMDLEIPSKFLQKNSEDQHFDPTLTLSNFSHKPILCLKNKKMDTCVNQVFMVIDGEVVLNLLKSPAFLEKDSFLQVELSFSYFDHIKNRFLFIVMAEADLEIIETFNLSVNGLIPEFVMESRMRKRSDAALLDLSEPPNKRNLPLFKVKMYLNELFTPRWDELDYAGTEYLDDTQLKEFKLLDEIKNDNFALNDQNYTTVLSLLTNVEDAFYSHQLEYFEMMLNVEETKIFCDINVMDEDEIPSMLSEADCVILTRADPEEAKREGVRQKVSCYIQKIQDGIISVAPSIGEIPKGLYRVKFERDRTCFRMELDALDRLESEVVVTALFPKVYGHNKDLAM